MKDNVKKLASEAGFILWGEESWNQGEIVDWSSGYDDALVKFAQLVAEDCVGKCKSIENDITLEEFDWTPLGAVEEIQFLISQEFDLGDVLEASNENGNADLLSRIQKNMVASCKCLTKTPDVEFHDADCLYRVLAESYELIRKV